MPSQVRQEGMWQLVHLPPHWSSSVGKCILVFSRAGNDNFMLKRWDWLKF
ncbi:hypothetical protein FOQG_04249 [Fusarium oxysporum f. sp. raphani 54005]|uniref:Uncharacterized protein n=4 Tax=Fusarium oxysporum TaxID=5507 RepID=X0CT37_FUSOX|nr:hypothetical protein FOVG_04691 [Fusarium oxysporum f. sp. pisi HDV247]EXK94039.1 hypothetical protein FOQG_04249 [Fusarium oxysporum f. sp. raphani 54005]EXL89231.1 hypothetical protein FOPG_00632 [Fusarium oxysporum f. sp. conglutinans race 2 54008]EXM31594.1 hypothetical protein FOTG_03355 [Fusarium oxysporum f. sp. vasinfectum 25433]